MEQTYFEQIQSFKKSLAKLIIAVIGIFAVCMGIIWLLNQGNSHNIYRGFSVMLPVSVFIFYLVFPLIVTANIKTFAATTAFGGLKAMDGILSIIFTGPPLAIFYVFPSYILFTASLAKGIYMKNCYLKGTADTAKPGFVWFLGLVIGQIVYWVSFLILVKFMSMMD